MPVLPLNRSYLRTGFPLTPRGFPLPFYSLSRADHAGTIIMSILSSQQP
jgi:hypothetical protein